MSRKPPLQKERLERARELRGEPTEAEKKLWEHLRRKNLSARFRRQHPIGPFFLDFYCHEARLAVEVDGGGHAERDQAEGMTGIAGIHVRATGRSPLREQRCDEKCGWCGGEDTRCPR